MVKDLITKWGEMMTRTLPKRIRTKGILRNVGGSTEGGGAKSKQNQIERGT
jgi:hypothetical protein